jgi:hypothetical protein
MVVKPGFFLQIIVHPGYDQKEDLPLRYTTCRPEKRSPWLAATPEGSGHTFTLLINPLLP